MSNYVAGQGIMITGNSPRVRCIDPDMISLEPYAAESLATLKGGKPGQILMKISEDEMEWVDPIDIFFFLTDEQQKIRNEQDGVKELYDQLIEKLHEYLVLVKLYKK